MNRSAVLTKNTQDTFISLRVVMAQVNPLVGDIHGNTELVIDKTRQAIALFQPDLVVFPELVLTAYPPEDLLLRSSLDIRIEKALEQIKQARLDTHLVVGYPGRDGKKLYNMLAVFSGDEILGTYKKHRLPNYQVFDEKRYFKSGDKPFALSVKGIRVGFSICEDLWRKGTMGLTAKKGARLMVNINGSPFHINKQQERIAVMQKRTREGAIPIIYVNQVGGQDELVFDGGSMALDQEGQLDSQSPMLEEALTLVTCQFDDTGCISIKGDIAEQPSDLTIIYDSLVLGMRDYVNKNGFNGVVLGLSGGIDSALTLAIAVDALGKDRVHAVMMPFEYTSKMSLEDAEQEAINLAVNYKVIPIGDIFNSYMTSLEEEFAGTQPGISEQNIQARCRGVLLMAISNKKGYLVLTTGNKSELAVGYSTLYGDMAGGFDVLKDVPKMLVYKLASYRNKLAGSPGAIIPQRVIDRPPSAELAPDQVDEDNLPPYDILDQILALYVEQDQSANAIIARGFDEETVNRVIRLVDLNEYKRRQAPIGVRISKKGFGRDRRYPITSGWKLGE